MEFIQQYAKELFSLIVPLVTWWVSYKFRARARLQVAAPHSYTFLVNEPLMDSQGNVIREAQTVHTTSHAITNIGKDTATRIELVFNWKPQYLNIWPIRHYEESLEKDNRYVMIFESLAPNESVGIELLSVNNDLPMLLTARSDQCVAQVVQMIPQPVLEGWKRRLGVALVFSGFSFAIYVTILILQFLLIGGSK